jgi:hypothetical protein
MPDIMGLFARCHGVMCGVDGSDIPRGVHSAVNHSSSCTVELAPLPLPPFLLPLPPLPLSLSLPPYFLLPIHMNTSSDLEVYKRRKIINSRFQRVKEQKAGPVFYF